MVFRGTSLLLLACLWPGEGRAQWEWLPAAAPQRIFAGAGREIPAVWRNPGTQPLAADMRLRLYQTSSRLAAPLDEKVWKRVELPAGQTILETASINFPAVRAETSFLIQWLAETNRVVGSTEVLVYPTNLLAELRLLGQAVGPLGLLDPDNALTASLQGSEVPFGDLAHTVLEGFSGRLAIVGPYQFRWQMRSDLARSVRKLAQRGVAVVWFQPPPGPHDRLVPSFYVVPEGKSVVVVAQGDLVAGLADQPQSQLNLIQLCKLALNPAPLPLPDTGPQP